MARRDPLANPEEAIRTIYAYVAYRIGHGPDAEDVVSETIERALRYRDSYKPSLGEPIAWLIGIARRCIVDRQVSSARAFAPADGPEWTDDSTETTVTRLDLRKALSTLDERSRELIALRYGADLTARQIGELLSMKTGTVEVALHRALAQLRSVLADENRPPGPAAGETTI